MLSDNFFKKVEKKTNVGKDTIISLAKKLQSSNMKDEKTINEVIDTLCSMTNRAISDDKRKKIISKIVEDKVPSNVEKMF